MKKVNLRRHNLNALPVLREILRHGNLTKASQSLGLTQPALSNVLKQLRMDFDDMLVVRQGQKMQLTPRALQLIGPLEESLRSIEDLLMSADFDPTDSDRCFRIATTDFIMALLSAPLTVLTADAAPHVSIQLHAAQRSSVQALMVGDIDMVITPTVLLNSGSSSQKENDSVGHEIILREPMTCLASKNDEQFRAGLTLDQYLQRPHAGYLFGEGSVDSIEQNSLKKLGLKQNDKLLVASYAALAPVVACAGYLALVPLSFAKAAARLFPVQYAPPPFDTSEMEWSMVWHLRNDQSSDMQWLRSCVKKALNTGLASPKPYAVDKIAL
jgi:LysR family transcriptional regulator, nod-box dependent transcriptional activator